MQESKTRHTIAAALPMTAADVTRIIEIAPDALQSPEVKAVCAIWQERRGSRPMPTRDEVLPRPLAKFLRYISLTRFTPESGDYEFRIVGDAHVQAYGANAQGERLSQTKSASPEFVAALTHCLDLVRSRRAPLGYRGIMGRDLSQASFDWFETLYMPLGTDSVDFILNAAVYRPREGKWRE
ncbi:MAG TPA: PAS domain-containing protein [Rhizomicrobium sp.]|jgi:hypothetical protein